MTTRLRYLLTAMMVFATLITFQSVALADGSMAPPVQETATPEPTVTIEGTETPTATVTVESTETPTATATVESSETPTATATIEATIEPTGTVMATETAIVTGTMEATTATPGAPQTLPQTGTAPATNDTNSLFFIGGLAMVGIVALGLVLGRRTR